MSKEDKKVPELRFKGFSDDWEQRKLEDDVSMVGGATPSKSNPNYWGGPIEWLSSQEIKEKYVSRGTYTITQKAIDEKTTKIVKSGTPLIVSRSGILARLFPISIPTKDMAINQDIKALIFNEDKINTNFFVAQLQNKEGFILKSIVKTGTTVQSINIPDFSKLELSYPLNEEQKRIGDFFYEIDCAITLHQREYEALVALKKIYIEKVLSQCLRFKDINNNNFPEWKLKKFSDFLAKPKELIKAKNINKDQLITVKLAGNGVTEANQNRALKLGATTYYKRYAGDFIYGKQNFFNGAFGFIPSYLDGNYTSGDVPSLVFNSELVDRNFFLNYISRENFYKRTEAFSTGTGSKRIHEETLLDFKIYLPIKEEQQKIGDSLLQIEKLIDADLKKLRLLRKLKSVYLNKMFI